MKYRNVVVIGGGTGTYTVLSGLKKYPVNLTAIVSMADNGGSTGILREEFGILPPGSVRPALVAMSQAEKSLADIFNFRFSKGSFKGHNFGNLFLTALTEQFGSFEKAIDEAGRILQIKGEVIPSTIEDIQLVAELNNGKIIQGEANIDVPKHNGNIPIKKIWLEPAARANPRALKAIKKAEVIVIGPGDLYSSILPNFLVGGMKNAIKKSRAKKIYVCNIMTKFGETNGFVALDFVSRISEYLGKNVLDCVVLNTAKPSAKRVKKYEKENAELVKYSPKDFNDAKFKVVASPLIRKSGFLRHDSDKLAKILCKL